MVVDAADSEIVSAVEGEVRPDAAEPDTGDASDTESVEWIKMGNLHGMVTQPEKFDGVWNDECNVLGYTACEAAYRHGERWRQALLDTLRGNRAFLLSYLERELPGIRVEAPIEATYLAWCNVEALGLPDPVAHFERHGVGLSDGRHFGARPGSHVRLNFGCPRATLAEALARMKRAL